MPFTLSPDQEAAKAALAPLFDAESETRVGILRGWAGTGKTFLVAHLISELMEAGWNVELLTPTGRASEVLGRQIERHMDSGGTAHMLQSKTVHSFIYQMQPADFNAEQLSLFADVKSHPWLDSPTVWIVDESSMVGDKPYEDESEDKDLRFGSGSLLNDLLDCAEIDPVNNLRILFVGDAGQLPPIRATEVACPALDAAALRKQLPVSLQHTPIAEAELTEVKRQEAGSLLEFVNDVRRAMETGEFLPRDPRDKVRPLEEGDLVSKYKELTQAGEEPSRAVVLAHTNHRVTNFNRVIRQALGRDHRLLHRDDVLLVKRNQKVLDFGELEMGFEAAPLRNGSFVQIIGEPIEDREVSIRIKGQMDPIPLEFWSARIRTIQNEGEKPREYEVKIFASRLRLRDRSMLQAYEQALFVDLQQRLKTRFNLTPKSPGQDGYEEYKRRVESDPYFNALRVEYGYAVTVHNSQGGEWPAVIVDPASNKAREWQNAPEHRRSYAKWVYTAITRAQEEVWCLRPGW